jgi:ADP-ribose pyrophosphatase YjhB (NUDIX family)
MIRAEARYPRCVGVSMAETINLEEIRPSRKKAAKRKSKLVGKPQKLDRAAKEQAWESFRTAFLSAPLATEMMSLQPAAAPVLPVQPAILQSGVLAFRRKSNGDPRVLLISRKRSKKWGIPKGKVGPHLSFRDNAVKEAFEEAGVVGYVSPFSVGVFHAKKRAVNAQQPEIMEVWVYLLEVAETLPDWPEKGKRVTRWVTCEAAARQLREPVLVHLCHRLAQS